VLILETNIFLSVQRMEDQRFASGSSGLESEECMGQRGKDVKGGRAVGGFTQDHFGGLSKDEGFRA